MPYWVSNKWFSKKIKSDVSVRDNRLIWGGFRARMWVKLELLKCGILGLFGTNTP